MPQEPPVASLPPGGIPWVATIPPPNCVWTLLLKSFGNVGLTLGISLLECPYMYLGALLTFLWIASPSKARNVMNFLVHAKGQQEDKGNTHLVLPRVFNLLHFPLIDVSFQWFVYYSQCLLNWTALSSRAWTYPPPIGSAGGSGQEEGFQPAKPKALLWSLFASRNKSQWEWARHGSSALAQQPLQWMNRSALSLLSGQPCPNSGPLKFLSHHR